MRLHKSVHSQYFQDTIAPIVALGCHPYTHASKDVQRCLVEENLNREGMGDDKEQYLCAKHCNGGSGQYEWYLLWRRETLVKWLRKNWVKLAHPARVAELPWVIANECCCDFNDFNDFYMV